MAKVKGTEVVEYVAVRNQPARQRIKQIVVALLIILSLVIAYILGASQSGRFSEFSLVDQLSMGRELQKTLAIEEELRRKLSVLENASFVDQKAIADVRNTNKLLSNRIAELEEEISLYQGIMSPSTGSVGLTIHSLSVMPSVAGNRYRYRLMLTQVGANSNYLNGYVTVTVRGLEAGAITTYSLHELSEDVDAVNIKFRYRYFQELSGNLSFPDDFIPDQLIVVARSLGSKAVQIEKEYIWSELEIDEHVGQ